MIHPTHLLHYVIRPVLKDLNLYSPQAERLLLGTACKESECGLWLKQIGGGPALGIYQMEPDTHLDHLMFLDRRVPLKLKVRAWGTGQDDMAGNLYYATAMCRVHYLRVPEPIPNDLPAQAAYYKKYYNTEKGAATIQEYIDAWNTFVPTGIV